MRRKKMFQDFNKNKINLYLSSNKNFLLLPFNVGVKSDVTSSVAQNFFLLHIFSCVIKVTLNKQK